MARLNGELEKLEKELNRVKEQHGMKNVELATLKVNVRKEEMEFQKRCKILEVCKCRLSCQKA